MGRKKRKKRKKQENISSFMIVALCFTGILLIMTLSLAFPIFQVEAFEVQGNTSIQAEDLLQASKIKEGQPLFKDFGGSFGQVFSKRYGIIENRIKKSFPWLEDVQAKLDFTAKKISIAVEEPKEICYLKVEDGCILLDKEGRLIKIQQQIPEGIPLIENIAMDKMVLGQIVKVNNEAAFLFALTQLDILVGLEKDLVLDIPFLETIRTIKPIDENIIYMTIVKASDQKELIVKVKNNSQLEDKMRWLKYALTQNAFDGLGEGILDLTEKKEVFKKNSKIE